MLCVLGSVVTDRRFVQNGSAFAIAEVVSATDYYPFGMEMPGRVFAGSKYVFGFNTQMKSPEILPGHTTAQFWEYDSRIGRRWELDPKTVTGWSGYACLGDSPIGMMDWLGDTIYLISSIYDINRLERVKVQAEIIESVNGVHNIYVVTTESNVQEIYKNNGGRMTDMVYEVGNFSSSGGFTYETPAKADGYLLTGYIDGSLNDFDTDEETRRAGVILSHEVNTHGTTSHIRLIIKDIPNFDNHYPKEADGTSSKTTSCGYLEAEYSDFVKGPLTRKYIQQNLKMSEVTKHKTNLYNELFNTSNKDAVPCWEEEVREVFSEPSHN